jgi:hypothetical protein
MPTQDSAQGVTPVAVPLAAPLAEPPTPRALWPTFLRRTLAEEALRRPPEPKRAAC